MLSKICQDVLDGRGMHEGWTISVAVSVFRWEGDTMSCGAYKGMKLLEYDMKIVENVLEKRIRELVNVD